MLVNKRIADTQPARWQGSRYREYRNELLLPFGFGPKALPNQVAAEYQEHYQPEQFRRVRFEPLGIYIVHIKKSQDGANNTH